MRQALEMALDALKDNQHLVADNERHAYVMEYNSIIDKCEEALAQPEQKPDVSHKLKFDCEFVDGTCADLTVYGSERDIKRLEARVKFWWNLEQHSGTPDSDKAERIRLGKPPQPEQEPVAVDCCANCLRPKNEHTGDLCPNPYTTVWHAWDYPFTPDATPPQRKPLTRAQIINALATTMNFNSRDYDEIIEPITRAIEAAHGIKE